LLGPVFVQVTALSGAAPAIAIGLLLSSVFALRGLIQSAWVARTEAGLYVRVVDSVLRQDVLQRSVLSDGEARAALFEGGHDVSRLVADVLPNLWANMVAAVGFAFFVAITQSGRTVLVIIVAGSVGVLLLALSRRAIDVSQAAASSAWSGLANGVSDAFEGRLEIVAGGRADAYVETFSETAAAWRSASLRVARLARLAGRLPLLALAASVGLAVVLDSAVRGEPVGQTITRAVFLASMAPAFIGCAQGMQEFVKNDARMRQILELVTIEPVAAQAGTQLPRDVRAVELRDVHFAYERGGRRHEAVTRVSFAWRANELLALAGPNGSGKSTCLRLLLGLGRRSGGDILVDGVPLERLDVDAWRRKIAFLPQHPYLPERVAVRRCLRFVDSDATDEVMIQALDRVGFACVLRHGTGSQLDVRVDELSVGQRQRVGLARVLCRRAPMILLDEPDANLDRAGVRLVTAMVRELARDHMVMVVAHSPELLAVADRVITLDSGRVVSEALRSPAPC
jgi:ABC-type multidrug transport system fused ATPase/permease subunit